MALKKKEKNLTFLKALKRMLLVKAISGEQTLHSLPQMMQANDELGLNLDHSLHPADALRILLCYCHNHTRPH